MGKNNYMKILVVVILSFVFTMGNYNDKVFAKENNIAKNMFERQIEIGSLISDIAIKDKDNLYIDSNYVEISLLTKDKNITKIEVDETRLNYSSHVEKFTGRVDSYYLKDRNHKPSKIKIHYKNGSIIEFNRNSSNEDIFKQFDFVLKTYTVKSIYVENKDNIAVGDNQKFVVQLNEILDQVIYLNYENDKGVKSSEILVYNKSKNRHESNNAKVSTPRNNKLMSIEIREYFGYDRYRSVEISDRWSYPDIFLSGDYYAKFDHFVAYKWELKDWKWYLHTENGLQKGWYNIDGTWYFFKKDGVMETGWGLIDGKWYYLKPSGAMHTGWEKIKDTWYFFKKDGAMETGWGLINGTWYYFNKDGAMKIGWELINGTWYYFKGSGGMATRWQSVSGKWYYLYNSGKMAKNTTIGGWKINSSGVATKIK